MKPYNITFQQVVFKKGNQYIDVNGCNGFTVYSLNYTVLNNSFGLFPGMFFNFDGKENQEVNQIISVASVHFLGLGAIIIKKRFI